MKKEITNIAPLRVGIVLGLVGLVGSLVEICIARIFMQLHGGASLSGLSGSYSLMIFIPIIIGFVGFISGAIGAAIYNMVAGWIGGIMYEERDVS